LINKSGNKLESTLLAFKQEALSKNFPPPHPS